MESGFKNFKVVARGSAIDKAIEVLNFVKSKAPQYIYEWSNTKSLNKKGEVCDEVHIMISMDSQAAISKPRQLTEKSRNGPTPFA